MHPFLLLGAGIAPVWTVQASGQAAWLKMRWLSHMKGTHAYPSFMRLLCGLAGFGLRNLGERLTGPAILNDLLPPVIDGAALWACRPQVEEGGQQLAGRAAAEPGPAATARAARMEPSHGERSHGGPSAPRSAHQHPHQHARPHPDGCPWAGLVSGVFWMHIICTTS